MPAIIGPVAGPLFGGLITTFSSWQWIFWLNVPVGVISLGLTLIFIDKVPPEPKRSFDFKGYFLIGFGLGAMILWLDLLPRGTGPAIWALCVLGLTGIGFYVLHARKSTAPILDLGLFRYTSFRANMLAGSVFRLGFGALPFLLPLLMQEIFHYSPLQSGAITFVSALGAFGIRIIAKRVIDRFGFRPVLVWNGLIASFSIAVFAAFPTEGWPVVMVIAIFLGGIFRALEFTALNALSFSEISQAEMSHATSMTQMALRFSQAIGISGAALLLHIGTVFQNGVLSQAAFDITFLVIGLLSAAASVSFLRLRADEGANLIEHRYKSAKL